jgi:hypothetical protein
VGHEKPLQLAVVSFKFSVKEEIRQAIAMEDARVVRNAISSGFVGLLGNDSGDFSVESLKVKS